MKSKKLLGTYRNFLGFEEISWKSKEISWNSKKFLGILRNSLEFEDDSWEQVDAARNAMPRDGPCPPFVVKPKEFHAFGIGRKSLESK